MCAVKVCLILVYDKDTLPHPSKMYKFVKNAIQFQIHGKSMIIPFPISFHSLFSSFSTAKCYFALEMSNK